MKKSKLLFPLFSLAIAALLSGCLKGENSITMSDEYGTIVENPPGFPFGKYISLDRMGSFIYDPSFQSSEYLHNQRVLTTFTYDYTKQTSNLFVVCKSIGLNKFQTYNLSEDPIDPSKENDPIAAFFVSAPIIADSTYTNYNDQYLLTFTGRHYKAEANPIILYFKEKKVPTNVNEPDTLKLEARFQSTLPQGAQISSGTFLYSFNLTDLVETTHSMENKRICIDIAYKTKNSAGQVTNTFFRTYPRVIKYYPAWLKPQ